MPEESAAPSPLEEAYANTFFPELSPVRLNYVAALGGGTPIPLDRPFTYLELGCGFGHSTVANAGAFPAGRFHGCDLNPDHAAAARGLAAALGLRNFECHECGFDALAAVNLPPFDFIVLHGVYSWVGPAARRAIREIIGRGLSERGMVYLSYNCLPGWAIELPLRRMLVELARGPGAAAARARHAVEALQRLADGQLRFFTENPSAAAAIAAYRAGPDAYLAHEFLAESWEAFYSIDLHEEMAGLGLRYLGSATLADNHPALLLDERKAAAVGALPPGPQRILAEDLAVNRRFRRDVFARNAAAPGSPSGRQALLALPIGRAASPAPPGARVRVPRGQLTFQDDFVAALNRLLETRSRPLGEVASALAGQGHGLAEVVRNILFLIAAGALTPFARAQALGAPAEPPYRAAGMLLATLAHGLDHDTTQAVPSEVLGNGIPVRPAEARALARRLADPALPAALERARREGPATPDQEAEALAATLVRLGLLGPAS